MKLILIDCDTIEGLKSFTGLKFAYNPNFICSLMINVCSKCVVMSLSDSDNYETFEFDTLENAEKFYNQLLECMSNA